MVSVYVYGAIAQTITSEMAREFPAFFLALLSVLLFSCGADRIQQLESIRDGARESLTSSGGTFVLGFFSPGGSTKRYLGIWYSFSKNTIVWVANRDKPLKNSYGILVLNSNGNLVLTDNSTKVYWSTNTISSSPITAKLLNTGNFVLTQEDNPTGEFLWQSFDYLTDTFLPGMKIGVDYRTGREWKITSWMNESDPSPGRYTFRLDTRGVLQPFFVSNSSIIFRSGPWNGINFSGNQAMKSFQNYSFQVVQSKEETYYYYEVKEESIFPRLVAEPSGELKRYQWDVNAGDWQQIWSVPKDNVCDKYNNCGPNAICSGDAAELCLCFSGTQPRKKEEWSIRNWSDGCERVTKLTCGDGDGFLPVAGVKFPDTVNSTVNMDLSIEECRAECSKNCSCVAYSKANISAGGRGCIMWNGDLIDVRTFAGSGQDMYLRLAKSDIEKIEGERSRKKNRVIIGLPIAAGLLFSFLLVIVYLMRRRRNNGNTFKRANDGSDFQSGELTHFDYATVVSATDNFSPANKIGSGGFGDVYKGTLRDGQIVAVKKISHESGERIGEFMTEVNLIAKLQHRNLVRLLGCCIKRGERILIYEFVPNRSLDYFVFGSEENRQALGWEKRLSVIMGVARGLLYLHQDSRLRIIHRDLKVANILLEEDMNPKISDFGTARVFERDQIDDNTSKVVGTFGYMSPEYIMSGNFSEKSDVFSFGVLVLEIISGRRNRRTSPQNHSMELLTEAWTLWSENRVQNLLDNALNSPTQMDDVIRYIRVGLLCVQESPDDRPTMQEVVLMLTNENTTLLQPGSPGFFRPTTSSAASFWHFLVNDLAIEERVLTITTLEGR